MKWNTDPPLCASVRASVSSVLGLKNTFSLLAFLFTCALPAQQHISPVITGSTSTHFFADGTIYAIDKLKNGATDSVLLYFPGLEVKRLKVDTTKHVTIGKHHEWIQSFRNSKISRVTTIDSAQDFTSDYFRLDGLSYLCVNRNLATGFVMNSFYRGETGPQLMKDYYRNGNLHQSYSGDTTVQYFPDGAMKLLNLHGVSQKTWYANGQLASYEKFKPAGQPDSIAVFYNTDGSLLRRVDYIGGKSEGDFYPNGQLRFKEHGKHIVDYYENGQRKSRNLRLGRLILSKNFYSNGEVESKGWKYKRRIRSRHPYGEHRVYFSTKKQGRWRYYNDSGQLIATGHYKSDYKYGEWKYFDDAGKSYSFPVDFTFARTNDNHTGADTTFTYVDNERTVSTICEEKNGVKHGSCTQYDLYGNISGYAVYRYGRLTGTSWHVKKDRQFGQLIDSTFADEYGNICVRTYSVKTGKLLIEGGLDKRNTLLYRKPYFNNGRGAAQVAGRWDQYVFVNEPAFVPDSTALANMDKHEIPKWFHIEWVADTAYANHWRQENYFTYGYSVPFATATFIDCYFVTYADSVLTEKIFEGVISKGKKNGTWTYYYANGKIMARGNYEDDLYTGEWRYYNKDGSLMMIANYKIFTVHPARKADRKMFERKEFCGVWWKNKPSQYGYFETVKISLKDGYYEFRRENNVASMMYEKGRIVKRL
jgi:antitoxin component YwqK of YwqJK toxin-antitoxin module